MPAKSDVRMKFFTDAAQAERAIVQLEKKYFDLENRIRQVGRRSKESSDQSITAFAKQALTIDRVGAGVQNMIRLFDNVAQQQGRVRQEFEQTGIALDTVIRKYQIQQGLGGLDGDASRRLATTIGTEAGVSQNAVLRVAKQLISTGFNDPLRSGAAQSVVAFLQSTAQDPETADLEGVVSAFAQQLSASDQQLNTRNLLRLGVQTRGLFGESPLEAPDLIDFAKVRGVATQLGIGQDEFLASAAVLKRGQSAAEASTGLGNFLTKLSAPRGRQLQALQELGVPVADVAFDDENLGTVVNRLKSAFDALPAERRTPVLANLFGAEKTNLAAGRALVQGEDTYREYLKLTQDTAGFEAGVNVARGGPASAIARLETQRAERSAQFLEAGGIPAEVLGSAQDVVDARTRVDLARGKRTALGQLFNLPGAALGVSGDQFLFEAGQLLDTLPAHLRAGDDARQLSRQALDHGSNFKLDDLLQENNQLMREQNELLRDERARKPAVNRQANSE